MKKHYTLLILLIFNVMQAQFLEDFNDGPFPPQGWILADNTVGTEASWEFNPPPYQGYEGTPCAFINRENIGLHATSEDWLIMPAVTVAPNDALTFYARQTLLGDTGTILRVLYSHESQTDLGSFQPLATWTETQLGGDAFLELRQKTVSLDGLVGQTIYIAFVRTFTQPGLATSGDRLILDNVAVDSVLSAKGFSPQTFGLYPNPVSETFKIDSNGQPVGSVTVYNEWGQRVASGVSPEINIAHLPQGIYSVQVVCGGKSETHRLIKK